jgi:small subunit ribosomal protein S17
MTEEERTEDQKQPEAAEEPAADDAGEQPAVEEAAPAEAEAGEDAPAEAGEDGDAEPAAEAPTDGGGDAEDGGAADEEEGLDHKTRRRLARSRLPTEPRPPRSPEERQAEREQARRAKAAQRSRHRRSRRARKGEPGSGTPAAERRANPAKVRQGVVVSDASDKTITVRIDIARRHPAYEKIVRQSRTLRAHDEANTAGQGDVVRIVETRPISRSKRWRLVEVVEKAR